MHIDSTDSLGAKLLHKFVHNESRGRGPRYGHNSISSASIATFASAIKRAFLMSQNSYALRRKTVITRRLFLNASHLPRRRNVVFNWLKNCIPSVFWPRAVGRCTEEDWTGLRRWEEFIRHGETRNYSNAKLVTCFWRGRSEKRFRVESRVVERYDEFDFSTPWFSNQAWYARLIARPIAFLHLSRITCV